MDSVSYSLVYTLFDSGGMEKMTGNGLDLGRGVMGTVKEKCSCEMAALSLHGSEYLF